VRFLVITFFLIFFCPPLFSQPAFSGDIKEEPFTFIGMTLEDVFNRFGMPRTVYVARGEEHWQDDVVFVYNEGEFYIFRNRVWKVGLNSVFGINTGDVRAVALLVLGDRVRDEGDFILYNIPGGGWPVTLRINFLAGRVSAIFVFRPDFQ